MGSRAITDFGLAKQLRQGLETLTGTGQVLGTPSYMPPEQAAGKIEPQIGPRADVYAHLGAMLYCLLTGRPPFQAATDHRYADAGTKTGAGRSASFERGRAG